MRVAGRFSLKRGAEVIEANFSDQLCEVLTVIESVDSAQQLKPRLIAIFVGVVALAIIVTGYLFNLLRIA